MIPTRNARVLLGLAAAAIAAPGLTAQQPLLGVYNRHFPRSGGATQLQWSLQGPGNAAILFADLAVGHTNVFGVDFELLASPALVPLASFSGGGALAFDPVILPANMPVFLQAAMWDTNQGLTSLRATNVTSFAAHDSPDAYAISFFVPEATMTGRFDHSVYTRLQAPPPEIHRVRPIPPGTLPFLQNPGTNCVLNPSGSRYQMALRAADLHADGSPMQLSGVNWRPLFGLVTAETFPQFEMRLAHTDAVPDYTIDSFSALPQFPLSGIVGTFANNPRVGVPTVSIYNGPYAIAPSQLRPNGYLPFPSPQQSFLYDGTSTLLLETLCSPQPGLGTPRNFLVPHLIVQSSPQPFATVAANAGFNGQPSPLAPANASTGTGGSYLFDVELEFVRTHSVVMTPFSPPSAFRDWQPVIPCAFTPPGTSIQFEFRGRNGATLTAWSSSQDIADGMDIQVRITMVADAATGAVPWIDTLIVPAR